MHIQCSMQLSSYMPDIFAAYKYIYMLCTKFRNVPNICLGGLTRYVISGRMSGKKSGIRPDIIFSIRPRTKAGYPANLITGQSLSKFDS